MVVKDGDSWSWSIRKKSPKQTKSKKYIFIHAWFLQNSWWLIIVPKKNVGILQGFFIPPAFFVISKSIFWLPNDLFFHSHLEACGWASWRRWGDSLEKHASWCSTQFLGSIEWTQTANAMIYNLPSCCKNMNNMSIRAGIVSSLPFVTRSAIQIIHPVRHES